MGRFRNHNAAVTLAPTGIGPRRNNPDRDDTGAGVDSGDDGGVNPKGGKTIDETGSTSSDESDGEEVAGVAQMHNSGAVGSRGDNDLDATDLLALALPARLVRSALNVAARGGAPGRSRGPTEEGPGRMGPRL